MKTIGLIGGITPESTIMYYRILNNLASEELGGLNTAKVLIYSVNFDEIAKWQREDRWDLLDDIMVNAAKSLQAGGASSILICANTMHLTIDAVKASVDIPVIHIAEETGRKIINAGLKKIALLGTKYTMEKAFFIDVLKEMGIETIVPDLETRNEIHRVIYDELSKGQLLPSSKAFYIETISNLIGKGAEGVILGCTEIPLLIKQDDIDVPAFDTTTIHATAAFEMAMR